MKAYSFSKAAALLCLSLVLSLLSGIILKESNASSAMASCVSSVMSCCATGECQAMRDCSCSLQPAQPASVPTVIGDRATQSLKLPVKAPTSLCGLTDTRLLSNKLALVHERAPVKPSRIYLLKRSLLI